MARQLAKEEFRAQFRCGPVTFIGITPVYSETYLGYRIFRALELLVLEDADGKFYTHSRGNGAA